MRKTYAMSIYLNGWKLLLRLWAHTSNSIWTISGYANQVAERGD